MERICVDRDMSILPSNAICNSSFEPIVPSTLERSCHCFWCKGKGFFTLPVAFVPRLHHFHTLWMPDHYIWGYNWQRPPAVGSTTILPKKIRRPSNPHLKEHPISRTSRIADLTKPNASFGCSIMKGTWCDLYHVILQIDIILKSSPFDLITWLR